MFCQDYIATDPEEIGLVESVPVRSSTPSSLMVKEFCGAAPLSFTWHDRVFLFPSSCMS